MYVSLWILIVVLLFIVTSLASIIFVSVYEKKKVKPKEEKKEKKPLEVIWELWKNAETPEEAVIYTDCYFALLEYYNDTDRH